MIFYPSGTPAADPTGAQSSAPRAGRRTRRSQIKIKTLAGDVAGVAAGLPENGCLGDRHRAGAGRGEPMQAPDTSPTAPPRRDDAGTFKITDRDITGLALCAEQYGAPYDLLAAALEVTVDRLRGITARWRHAGYATTRSLGRGPAWCWLTPAGMRLLGVTYPAGEPPVTRLAHIRAVLAARLWLQSGEVYQDGQAWWRSERRIRATGGHAGTAHIPDAEIHWPSLDSSPYGGQIWAIVAELAPKPLDRTTAIMRELLTRTSDYGPGPTTSRTPRYGQIVYLTAPAAAPTVTAAITGLPAPLQARITTRHLPPGALR
jgi:hypothetical protein